MPFLPEVNLAYPVHISIGRPSNNGFVSASVGSGFYCNTPGATYVVTAKHVLFDKGIELYGNQVVLTSVGNDLKSKVVIDVNAETLLASGLLKKHATADVAVAKLGTVKANDPNSVLKFHDGVKTESDLPKGVGIVGLPKALTLSLDQVGISNDVITFGYPTSLGREAQIDRSRPLLRRGMVAGKTEDRRIVIDCPVYFGSSGGLVIEVEQKALGQFHFRGIGLATEMVPFVEELWSKQFKAQTGLRYENSGYSLVEPFDRVLELF